jgi:hypothetical protein
MNFEILSLELPGHCLVLSLTRTMKSLSISGIIIWETYLLALLAHHLIIFSDKFLDTKANIDIILLSERLKMELYLAIKSISLAMCTARLLFRALSFRCSTDGTTFPGLWSSLGLLLSHNEEELMKISLPFLV